MGADRTPAKLMKSVALAMLFTFIIYVSCGILSIYLFGSSLSTNVLDNISAEAGNNLSLVVRVAFSIVLACHIPYVFYYGKEGALVIVDECMN